MDDPFFDYISPNIGFSIMKIRQIFLLLLFFYGIVLNGQDDSPWYMPVFHAGKQLNFPFTGSWGAPQFNQLDIDLDGTPDLIVFDRETQRTDVFLQKNGRFDHAPQYAAKFPEISEWMILRDLNGDGLEDIFTAPMQTSNASIIVYQAVLKEGEIRFERLYFPYGTGDVISYLFFGSWYGVYVARTDIPAIADLDQDGDLDILAFESGGGTINFYRNLCMEEGLPPEQFKVELADRCWGKFRESFLDENIVLSHDPNECAEGSGFRHAGSTITLFDPDADNDQDILLGDTDYAGLIFIENGSFPEAYGIAQERDYPQYDEPANLNWFLGSFILDLWAEHQPGMLVSPNTSVGSKNFDNIWLYRDIDPSATILWELETSRFLLEETIDWGGEVYPSFEDIDQDGLTDLILGLGGLIDNDNQATAKMIWYKNTGTAAEPELTLWNEDFLGLSGEGYRFLAPTFGDLTGDGARDLIVGESEGTLLFFRNRANPGDPYLFDPALKKYMSLDVGYRALPCIVDIDGDGLNDLLVGNELSFQQNGQTGSLAFFKNNGTPEYPLFNPDGNGNGVPWAGIGLHANSFNLTSLVRPYTFETNDGTFLALGSVRGTIVLYQLSDEGEASLVEDSMNAWDFGAFSAPAVADMDSDGFLEFMTGTSAGGLIAYDTALRSDLDDVNGPILSGQDLFELFPNPVSGILQVRFLNDASTSTSYQISIINHLGINYYNNVISGKTLRIDCTGFPRGYYWIRCTTTGVHQLTPFGVF
jgi:hypothetical protein